MNFFRAGIIFLTTATLPVQNTNASTWHMVQSQDWKTSSNLSLLLAASYLTEPVCKCREYYYSLFIPHSPEASRVEKVGRVFFLIVGMAICALIAPIATPIGIALRSAVAYFAPQAYLLLEREGESKQLPVDRTIKIASFNVCLMPAGYSITDGQVSPPSDRRRVDDLLEMVLVENPDVICFYEVADIRDALYLTSKLKDYPHVVPVAGIRGIGPSSMLYVASKYKMANIEFTPFAKRSEVTGRASYSEKGFLTFDLQNRDGSAPFASVISTHLQHSEIPDKREDHEIESRRAQLKRIAEKVREKASQHLSVIVTGDLNQNESEISASLSAEKDLFRRDLRIEQIPTWGGDSWCKRLMGEPASQAQVLDYTLIAGRAESIRTQIIPTTYSSDRFGGASDHFLLVSDVVIPLQEK